MALVMSPIVMSDVLSCSFTQLPGCLSNLVSCSQVVSLQLGIALLFIPITRHGRWEWALRRKENLSGSFLFLQSSGLFGKKEIEDASKGKF